MEMDESTRALLNQMSSTMQTAVVAQVIQTYDNFALAAMSALLRNGEWDDPPAAQLAEDAWKMADAMMTERKKRGLGGAP